MTEKLCLQWSDFKENVNSAFGKLRSDNDFTDVTLTCGDGEHFEAHKVVLTASSPFFEKIFQKTKHPRPLIYLGEFKSNHFASILDFLYFGEANVFQEDLDSFLAIAEELKLKGLTGQTSKDLLEQRENLDRIETAAKSKDLFAEELNLKGLTGQHSMYLLEEQGKSDRIETTTKSKDPFLECTISKTDLTTSGNTKTSQSGTNLQELDEKAKSMMERGHKLLPAGKQTNGKPKKMRSFICQVCGKEGLFINIRHHIEDNHLEGISLPCDFCDKIFSSRNGLCKHKRVVHK